MERMKTKTLNTKRDVAIHAARKLIRELHEAGDIGEIVEALELGLAMEIPGLRFEILYSPRELKS
jgi:hypothetical protein